MDDQTGESVGGRRAVDPVCGVAVDPETAYASDEHDGRRFYFSNRSCHEAFLANPHRSGHSHAPDDPRPEQDKVTGP